MVKLWNSLSSGFFFFFSGLPEILTLARFSILVTSSSGIRVTSSDPEPVVNKNYFGQEDGDEEEENLRHAGSVPKLAILKKIRK